MKDTKTKQEEFQKPLFVDFADYRDFLNAYVGHLKSKNPRYSRNSISKKWGISSAFLSLILRKKRHLGLHCAEKISSSIGLNDNENMLFTIELLRATTRSSLQKKYFHQIGEQIRGLIRMKYEGPLASNDFKWSVDRYGTELSFVLSSLLEVPGAKAEADWIQKRLVDKSYSIDEIKEGLDKINKTSAPTNNELTPVLSGGLDSTLVYRPAFMLYNKALEDSDSYAPNTFGAISVTYSLEAFAQASVEFQKFCRKLMDLENHPSKGSKDNVFIFSGGLFCAAKSSE